MSSDDSPELLDGRRTRWQEHNQVRRQVIIDAAITVMERQAPGEEVQVQSVADEAGMSRTVIYRHFADRGDLDIAVQRQICEDIGNTLLPSLMRDGTTEEVIRFIASAFVGWASAHPTLYWFAQRDFSGWGPSPLSQAIQQVAETVETLMATVVDSLGAELTDDDRAALDPWVFGLIGGVFAGVWRWIERPVREPKPEVFVDVIKETIWVQINGLALSRGLDVSGVHISALVEPFALNDPEGE
ncbi:TetR/AcrR family transcriptional regulator [Nocardioides sp. WS12]|uniref:TetR/AcrR family transcriptional regulator n=1 Tax=Nocardioides sp. WS12 TaxID=2486272 RepID=UPI0015F89DC1|nr:TetR/AcrR family transcriptional regulator [Nocardioides sp. WS12]